MTSISAFVPFVALKVPRDMPTANIQHALRETLVYFLERTRSAVAELYPTLQAKTSELYLELPECRRMVTVEGVYFVPQQECGVNQRQLRWSPVWEQVPFADDTGHGGWSMDDGDGELTTMWVMPSQTRDRRVCVRYSWTPKRDATCEVPEWVFERYADAIADGALAYLHSNPADESANMRFASTAGAEFQRAINEARGRHLAAQFGPRHLKPTSSNFFKG
jgi:hypothetical protein